MYCKNCGNKVKDDSKFCAECGKNVDGKVYVASEIIIKNNRSNLSKKMTNKLLCRLAVWPWIIILILALLEVFTGKGFGIFIGILFSIGGLMILVFGIWGLVRLAKAKHRVATIIVVLIVAVVIFQKIEIIYDLAEIALFISTVIGFIELNKLPDNMATDK